MPPLLLAIGIATVAVLLMLLGWEIERRRKEALRALARRLGLTFREGKDYSIPDRYAFLDTLCTGDNRYAFNILEGTYRDHVVTAFDFHYETYTHTKKGRKTHHHYSSFFMLHLDRPFPELRIYPENFLSKIGQALGYDDIDFESVEFSKAFTVRSKDKKFAYDICHTGMMTYLLKHPDIRVEIDGTCLSVSAPSRVTISQVRPRLDQLIEIRALFPRYLFENTVRR